MGATVATPEAATDRREPEPEADRRIQVHQGTQRLQRQTG